MLISRPCESFLMFKIFLSLGEFVSPYNIWETLTFEIRRTQMPDENIHDRTLGWERQNHCFSTAAQQYAINHFKYLDIQFLCIIEIEMFTHKLVF